MWLNTRVIVPVSLTGNVGAAIVAFLLFPFTGDVVLCYLVAGGASLGAGACLSVFALRDFRLRHIILALIVHAAALIFVFAGIYRGYGLLQGSTPVSTVSWEIALYFSVVTWTTLGYGDFTPRPGLELIAAAEALLGYVFFGLIVSLGAAVIRR